MKRSMFLVAVLLLGIAAPALAGVNVDDVADEVSIDGLYIEPGLDANTSALNASITRAGNNGVRLMVVLLDADPSGGAVTFADAILDRVPDGTVLVLSGERRHGFDRVRGERWMRHSTGVSSHRPRPDRIGG